MSDDPFAVLTRLDEIERLHVDVTQGEWPGEEECDACVQDWPCDAAQLVVAVRALVKEVEKGLFTVVFDPARLPRHEPTVYVSDDAE